MELYGVLGVEKTATEDEIKTAFRKLALQIHPDKAPNQDTAEDFKRIGEAYAILSDPLRRRKYDAARLFSSSPRPGEPPRDQTLVLWEAARRGDVAELESAYRRGGRVAWRNPGEDGRSPLHAAARGGHLDCIKALVERGAELEALSIYKETALHESGSGEVARLLIRMGLDVDARNKYNATPLHCASADGMLEVARTLVELGALLHAENVYGMTPCELAHVRGHTDVHLFLASCEQRGRGVIGTIPLAHTLNTSSAHTHAGRLELEDSARQTTATHADITTCLSGGHATTRDSHCPSASRDCSAAAVTVPYPHNGARRSKGSAQIEETEQSANGARWSRGSAQVDETERWANGVRRSNGMEESALGAKNKANVSSGTMDTFVPKAPLSWFGMVMARQDLPDPLAVRDSGDVSKSRMGASSRRCVDELGMVTCKGEVSKDQVMTEWHRPPPGEFDM